MHTDILTANQARILAVLDEMPILRDFYLAGGTALALRYGHRESVHFDFYNEKPFSPEEVLEQLQERGRTALDHKNEKTLRVSFEDVACSFFLYKYPILQEFVCYKSQIRVSSVADIAAMKIAAISGRGRKRDFVDLYFVCRKDYSLNQALELYQKKYKVLNQDFYHIYKSLVYFDDAEPDEMPKMCERTNWEEIKKFFEQEVRQLMESKQFKDEP